MNWLVPLTLLNFKTIGCVKIGIYQKWLKTKKKKKWTESINGMNNTSRVFNASQIEFFSQDEYISIIPNENIPVIHLMTVKLFNIKNICKKFILIGLIFGFFRVI